MNIDLITIFGNISKSLGPVQELIKWGAFALGMAFMVVALLKLKKAMVHNASTHEKLGPSVMYFLIGAVLMYLPTALQVMSNTVFGVDNIMSYTGIGQVSIKDSVIVVIRTVGLIWFVRGCVLIAHASEPGKQHGVKGLLFLVAGVFAINYEGTVAMLSWIIQNLIEGSKSLKSTVGY